MTASTLNIKANHEPRSLDTVFILVFTTLNTTPDYFPEEKAVFGLGRIGMKFRQNLRGAK